MRSCIATCIARRLDAPSPREECGVSRIFARTWSTRATRCLRNFSLDIPTAAPVSERVQCKGRLKQRAGSTSAVPTRVIVATLKTAHRARFSRNSVRDLREISRSFRALVGKQHELLPDNRRARFYDQDAMLCLQLLCVKNMPSLRPSSGRKTENALRKRETSNICGCNHLEQQLL